MRHGFSLATTISYHVSKTKCTHQTGRKTLAHVSNGKNCICFTAYQLFNKDPISSLCNPLIPSVDMRVLGSGGTGRPRFIGVVPSVAIAWWVRSWNDPTMERPGREITLHSRGRAYIYMFIYICIYVYMYIYMHQSVCLSVYLSTYLYQSICLYVCLSVCLSAYLPTCLPTYLPADSSIYLPICLSYLSACLSI